MELEFLLNLLERVVCFAGAGWLAAVILQRTSGSTRTVLLLSILIGCLSIPLAAAFFPARTAPLQSEGQVLQSASQIFQTAEVRPQRSGGTQTFEHEGISEASPAPIPWSQIMLAIWGGVSLVLLSRVLAGAMVARQSAVQAKPQIMGGRKVRLSDNVFSPMTVIPGTIILPTAMVEWPAERLEAVLTHEEVHARRKDAVWMLLSNIICALYWPVPFIWLLQRALIRAMEDSADDAVLARNIDPISYAETLRQAAQEFRSPRFPAIAFGAKPMITSRIERILSPLVNRSQARPQVTACASFAILIVAGGSSYGLRQEDVPAPLPSGGKGLVQKKPSAQVEVVQIQTMDKNPVYWRPDGTKIPAREAITRPHNLTPKPGDVVVWLRVKTDRVDAMLWMPTAAGFNTNSGPSFDKDGWLYSASRIATFGKKLPAKGDVNASATISDWTELPDFLTADMISKGQADKERFRLKSPYHSIQWSEGKFAFDTFVNSKKVGKEAPVDAWRMDIGTLHGVDINNYNIQVKFKDESKRGRSSFEHFTNSPYDEAMNHHIIWFEGSISNLERAWMRVRRSETVMIKNIALKPKS